MAFTSVTNTFVDGNTITAAGINQNFTDIINGLSDTTKDISVGAITAAGAVTLGAASSLTVNAAAAATFNGNVTLGSAGKSILFTGSLASTIPILTHNSFNIGDATHGLASVYLGGTSTFTTRLLSGATSSWTMTMPVSGGTANQILLTNGSGTTSWTGAITATATMASNFAVGANAAIKFDTKLTDTNTAYAVGTGLFTAPITGNYLVTFTGSSNGLTNIYVTKNGTNLCYLVQLTTAAVFYSASIVIPASATDTIGIFSDTAVTIFGSSPPSGSFSITYQR